MSGSHSSGSSCTACCFQNHMFLFMLPVMQGRLCQHLVRVCPEQPPTASVVLVVLTLHFTMSFRSEWRNNFRSRRRNALCNRRRQRWWVDTNPKEWRWGGLCPDVVCWSLFGQKCQRCYDLYLILLLLLYLLSQRYPTLQLLCVADRAFEKSVQCHKVHYFVRGLTWLAVLQNVLFIDQRRIVW